MHHQLFQSSVTVLVAESCPPPLPSIAMLGTYLLVSIQGSSYRPEALVTGQQPRYTASFQFVESVAISDVTTLLLMSLNNRHTLNAVQVCI